MTTITRRAAFAAPLTLAASAGAGDRYPRARGSVSYTHLTLPTIYSV